ncbi:MAG TPA: hypothetical protein VGQ03_05315 [Nitrososphaera sp.]|nr:hypothetical protein [Nitrososphaera sp.]
MSTAANGSPRLKASRIKIATIILFGVGLIAASLLIYQRLTPTTKLVEISKDEAIAAALSRVEKEPDRDASLLPYERASAEVLHVTSDGTAFVTDEKSYDDMWYVSYSGLTIPAEIHDRYFWSVKIETFDSYGDSYSSRGYNYLVDVTSGETIRTDLFLP